MRGRVTTRHDDVFYSEFILRQGDLPLHYRGLARTSTVAMGLIHRGVEVSSEGGVARGFGTRIDTAAHGGSDARQPTRHRHRRTVWVSSVTDGEVRREQTWRGEERRESGFTGSGWALVGGAGVSTPGQPVGGFGDMVWPIGSRHAARHTRPRPRSASSHVLGSESSPGV